MTLPHALDLVLLLQHLLHTLPRDGRWRGAIMLSVDLDQPRLVGHDGLRLYVAPAHAPDRLHGTSARELMARLAAITPRIDLTASPQRFDVDGGGPVVDRLHAIDRSDQALVRLAIDDASAHLARWRHRLAERGARLRDAGAWERCPICAPLPDAFPFWRGTTPDGKPQIAEWFLGIVDAPDSADMTDRGECTKRCPWCATRYRWRSDYEYLVNGASETETSLTRLA